MREADDADHSSEDDEHGLKKQRIPRYDLDYWQQRYYKDAETHGPEYQYDWYLEFAQSELPGRNAGLR